MSEKVYIPEIVEDAPVYKCTHDPKYQTCRGCNDDWCKDCYDKHECD